jgi:hypothetical protein
MQNVFFAVAPTRTSHKIKKYLEESATNCFEAISDLIGFDSTRENSPKTVCEYESEPSCSAIERTKTVCSEPVQVVVVFDEERRRTTGCRETRPPSASARTDGEEAPEGEEPLGRVLMSVRELGTRLSHLEELVY